MKKKHCIYIKFLTLSLRHTSPVFFKHISLSFTAGGLLSCVLLFRSALFVFLAPLCPALSSVVLFRHPVRLDRISPHPRSTWLCFSGPLFYSALPVRLRVWLACDFFFMFDSIVLLWYNITHHSASFLLY